MNGERRDPTQDELDFMLRQGFIWQGEYLNKWIFEKNGTEYDLSAADIFQIEDIEKNKRFVINVFGPA